MRRNVLLVVVDQWRADRTPPLFFDLGADPYQFADLAGDPGHRELVLRYAQKAPSWRLVDADRSLGRYRGTLQGLERRPDPRGGSMPCHTSDAAMP